jgi:hypothetical protein
MVVNSKLMERQREQDRVWMRQMARRKHQDHLDKERDHLIYSHRKHRLKEAPSHRPNILSI